MSGPAREARVVLRNRWYIAAWDSEVDRDPLSIVICGEHIVLYRRLDRSIVALRDACPHRLLPLSLDLKEGDHLRCKYHGLLVDGDGRCLEMPIASEPPNEALRVQSYPTVERYRFVWVWMGEAEKADPPVLPDPWACEAPHWVFDDGHCRIGCDYRLLIDNLIDLTHETYVHAGSIGQQELMKAAPKTRVDGDEVYVTRWIPAIDSPPFWRDVLTNPGKVDRWPNVGVAPVRAGATVERHDEGVRGTVIDCMTPETATSTHYFWGMARNFEVRDAGFTARFKRQQGIVFTQDEVILDAQQRSIEENPDLRLRTFSIDAGGVRAWAIIDRLTRAQATQAASSPVEPA